MDQQFKVKPFERNWVKDEKSNKFVEAKSSKQNLHALDFVNFYYTRADNQLCQAYDYLRVNFPKLESPVDPPKNESKDPHKVIEDKLEKFRERMKALRKKEEEDAAEKKQLETDLDESENLSWEESEENKPTHQQMLQEKIKNTKAKVDTNLSNLKTSRPTTARKKSIYPH